MNVCNFSEDVLLLCTCGGLSGTEWGEEGESAARIVLRRCAWAERRTTSQKVKANGQQATLSTTQPSGTRCLDGGKDGNLAIALIDPVKLSLSCCCV